MGSQTLLIQQALDILTAGGTIAGAVPGDDNIDIAFITEFRTVSGLMGFDTKQNFAIGPKAISLPGVGALSQPGSQIAAEQNVLAFLD